MNIYNFIRNTLLPLGVPVEAELYTGNETTYLVFNRYNETGELHADNSEEVTRHSVQVSAFGLGDITDLAKSMRNIMVANGFHRIGFYESFEEATKMYHQGYRFYYYEYKTQEVI